MGKRKENTQKIAVEQMIQPQLKDWLEKNYFPDLTVVLMKQGIRSIDALTARSTADLDSLPLGKNGFLKTTFKEAVEKLKNPPSITPSSQVAIPNATQPAHETALAVAVDAAKYNNCRTCHQKKLIRDPTHGAGKCQKCVDCNTCPAKPKLLAHPNNPSNLEKVKKTEAAKQLQLELKVPEVPAITPSDTEDAVNLLAKIRPDLFDTAPGSLGRARAIGAVASHQRIVKDALDKYRDDIKRIRREVQNDGDPVQRLQHVQSLKQPFCLPNPIQEYVALTQALDHQLLQAHGDPQPMTIEPQAPAPRIEEPQPPPGTAEEVPTHYSPDPNVVVTVE